MNIREEQVTVSKKLFLKALNRRMDFFKGLFLLALAGVPLGIWVGQDPSEILAIGFAAFLMLLFNLGNRITRKVTFSRKGSEVFFEPRIYEISEEGISIEYSNEEKIVFTKSKKLKIRRKKEYFTLYDKNQGFEILPLNVFSSQKEMDWFTEFYGK